MISTPILLGILYAGLAGTVLSLIVATITNRWSLRVFFLLALRLAIGWHFLFEGLYKINSYYTGPTDTNRVFTSEPYFKVAPGPIGEKMRAEFTNLNAEIDAKVKAPGSISPAEFAWTSAEFEKELKTIQDEEATALLAAKSPDEKKQAMEKAEAARKVARLKRDTSQASHCPEAVAKLIDAVKDEPAKDREKADKMEETETAKAETEAGKAIVKERADKAREAAAKKAERFASPEGQARFTEAKATYARWVYGVDARDSKVKGITGDVPLSGPQRIERLDWLQQKADAAEERETNSLGRGTGTDNKRIAEFRTDALNARYDLVSDANAFIAELKKDLNGGKAVEEPAVQSRGQLMDRVTMWFLVVVGVMLMAGLFTRVSCLLGAGFLVMTYLAHPAFPWYPLPPNTEGNPVFINKNVIEALALLVLFCYPTGRWLGLDAIVLRPFCKYKPETC